MNELIINTANSDLVIILKNDDKIYLKKEQSVKKHNERIMFLIDSVLNEANLVLSQIDKFGVVIGPGSFTGIRVGIATIKAFRDVVKKPALGINNLDLLYELAKKQNIKFVAIEGSLNSYFFAEQKENGLHVYLRNLSEDEVKNIVGNEKVGCYNISENMKNTQIAFKQLEFEANALVSVFEKSKDESLIPIYYQLSQAENDKISKALNNILPLNEKDSNEILNLEKNCFCDSKCGDSPWSEDFIKNSLLKKSHYINLGCFIDEKLIGYISGEETDEINVSRVAVSPDYRNHSIATTLIKKLEEIAVDKQKNLSLEVCENNLVALNLYQKAGFVTRRIRKNYYKDGSNCIEMIKPIA